MDIEDIIEEGGIDFIIGDIRSGGLEEDIFRIGIFSKVWWEISKVWEIWKIIKNLFVIDVIRRDI